MKMNTESCLEIEYVDVLNKMLSHINFDPKLIKGGTNGPYRDEESPLRNYCHYLTAISIYSMKTQDTSTYRSFSSELYNLIVNYVNDYPHGILFRKSDNKDKLNGVIGLAWLIEALTEYHTAFEAQDSLDLAREIYRRVKFDYSLGCWCRLGLDGRVLSPDVTFNHQLWFASMAAGLGIAEVEIDISRFIEVNLTNIIQYSDGTIYHLSPVGRDFYYAKFGMRSFISRIKSRVIKQKLMKKLRDKSVGYHGFNLYALAHILEKSSFQYNLDRVLTQLTGQNSVNDQYLLDIKNSNYSLRYNLSYFEFLYFTKVFKNDSGLGEFLNKLKLLQWEDSYDPKTGMFLKNVPDIATSIARHYQIFRTM